MCRDADTYNRFKYVDDYDYYKFADKVVEEEIEIYPDQGIATEGR